MKVTIFSYFTLKNFRRHERSDINETTRFIEHTVLLVMTMYT